MKKITFIILLALACAASLQAQKRTFTREYHYQASEADSKSTARTYATIQIRNILLREVGEFLLAAIHDGASGKLPQKIEAIVAGIVEMKILDERWDGTTYYIKAEMTVDSEDLERRIDEELNGKPECSRVQVAKAELERLKKELAEKYYTTGTNAGDSGFHERAIEYYQKAIEFDPNHARAYKNMGVAYDNLKNYREAIQCYQKAVTIDPNYVDAYNNMGITYYNLKNYREAIRCYQKAVDIDPNYATAYSHMGIAYGYLGNTVEQSRSYQQAARLGHSGAQAWLRKNGYNW